MTFAKFLPELKFENEESPIISELEFYLIGFEFPPVLYIRFKRITFKKRFILFIG